MIQDQQVPMDSMNPSKYGRSSPNDNHPKNMKPNKMIMKITKKVPRSTLAYTSDEQCLKATIITFINHQRFHLCCGVIVKNDGRLSLLLRDGWWQAIVVVMVSYRMVWWWWLSRMFMWVGNTYEEQGVPHCVQSHTHLQVLERDESLQNDVCNGVKSCHR